MVACEHESIVGVSTELDVGCCCCCCRYLLSVVSPMKKLVVVKLAALLASQLGSSDSLVASGTCGGRRDSIGGQGMLG